MKKRSPLWLGLNSKIRWGRTQVPAFKDEEAWRLMLQEIGGKASLGDMDTRGMSRIVDHLAREFGVEFSKGKASSGPYTVGAAGRRSDFYEIPDGMPHASLKRKILKLWKLLGYDVKKIDTRIKRQYGVEALRWCHDRDALSTIAKDLEKRLARKRKKEEAAQAAV